MHILWKIFTTSRGLHIHESRVHPTAMDKAASADRATVPSPVIPSCSLLDPNVEVAQHHISSTPDTAFVHTKDATFDPCLASYGVKLRLQLPHVQDKKKWNYLEGKLVDAINVSLPSNLRRTGDVNYIMQRFEERVYDVLSEECGVFNPRRTVPRKVHPSRMVQKLRRIKRDARRHLRTLKRERKSTDVAQRDYFQILRSYHKVQRITQKNKAVSKGIWEKKRFLHDPQAFATGLFNPPQKGSPTFSKATAETYFNDSCSDSNRDYVYAAREMMKRPDPPQIPFNCDFPSFQNFSRLCWRKRNKSAPGCNGISYQVYKLCPKVRMLLWEILKRIWSGDIIPSIWKIARIRLIAKSSDTSHPSLMRPISVLNTEGRLFFSVYQEKMATFMLKNGFISQGVQKAFLDGVPGCITHNPLSRSFPRCEGKTPLNLCRLDGYRQCLWIHESQFYSVCSRVLSRACPSAEADLVLL
jgi:hypothetical protein